MIRMATPLMKPVITDLGTNRSREPNLNRPRTSMMAPVSIDSMKSAPPAFSPPCTCGTLATRRDMALVVCTLMKTELAKSAPTGVATSTAYRA